MGIPDVKKMKAEHDVKGLIKTLGNKQCSTWRLTAAQALGEVGDSRAVKPLIAKLKEKWVDMSKAVAEALGKIGDPRAVQPLTSLLLKEDDYYVRRAAVQALGEIGDPGAVQPLVSLLLKEENLYIRKAAAEALGKIGDPRAIQPLATLFRKEDDTHGRYIEAEALRKLGWEPDDEEISAWYWLALDHYSNNVEWEKVVALGPVAIKPLIATIKYLGYSEIRRLHAAETLDKLGWKPDEEECCAYYWLAKGDWGKLITLGSVSVEPLITYLNNIINNRFKEEIVISGIEILGEIGGTRAVEYLEGILQDYHKSVDIQIAAVKALGKIGGLRAIDILTTAGKDKDQWYEVSDAAIAELSKIGTEVKLTVSNDDIVIDERQGLMWQRKDDGVECNFEDALSYCSSLELAGHNDWRMPSTEELQELASVSFEKLKQFFPDIKAERYWALATADQLSWAEAPERIAYTVDFDPESGNYRQPITYYKTYSYFVRAVRNAR